MATVDQFVIPAREGRAVRVAAGDRVRVMDREGGQVADLFAFVAGDPSEYLSAQHTRAVLDRLFPRVGEAFHSNRRRPLLTLLDDSSPGLHDMLIAACDPERYQGLGVTGWHASCQENLHRALEAHDVHVPLTPQSVNLFMHIPVAVDGALGWEPAQSRPGDAVTLEAHTDLLVAVSACPQDIVPINNLDPTSIGIEVHRG